VLEDAGKTIGVVTGVLGMRWYDCVVTGMEAHAGPTPMALRKDALQVATRIMQEVVAIAHRYPPYGRGTVGMVQCTRTAATSSPVGEVLDRPAQRRLGTRLDAMDKEIRAFIAKTAKESGLGITIEQVSLLPAVPVREAAASRPCATAAERSATR
jgi:N-carbamoyl-L-amino-acid hydrolase